MKFISLAVMALLGTSDAIKLKDMETDDAVATEVATQISAEGGDAGAAPSDEAAAAAAAGVDPAMLAQAQAEAQA